MQTECLVVGRRPVRDPRARPVPADDAMATIRSNGGSKPRSGLSRRFCFDGVAASVEADLSPVEAASAPADRARSGTRTEGPGEVAMLSVHTILTVQGGEFVSLMDPPAGVCRGRRGLPQCRHLACPGGRGRRARHDALVADHPLRLSAARAGKSRQPVRRDRNRRDPDASHSDALRRGEGRDPGRRRTGARSAGALGIAWPGATPETARRGARSCGRWER